MRWKFVSDFFKKDSLVHEIVKKIHFLFAISESLIEFYHFDRKKFLRFSMLNKMPISTWYYQAWNPFLICSFVCLFVQCNFKWGYEISAVSKANACIKRLFLLSSSSRIWIHPCKYNSEFISIALENITHTVSCIGNVLFSVLFVEMVRMKSKI